MTEIRWQLYLAFKWFAMAICPPGRREAIEALEDAQAEAFEKMMDDVQAQAIQQVMEK